jgi:hypothetical protein
MIVVIDTVFTAQWPAVRGSSFKTSDEVAADIAGGITTKFAIALVLALEKCFEDFRDE